MGLCSSLASVGNWVVGWGSSMTGYLSNSYLEGRKEDYTEGTALVGKEAQSFTLSRGEVRSVIFVVCRIFMFCLCLDMITEWPCFLF